MLQLTCRNLTLGYDSKPIIENLNFSVNERDYLCIVGENGAGKTTLMKALLGLHAPISGEIVVGCEPKPPTKHKRLETKQIGYLPQQTTAQRDFPASVKEIVLSGCQGRCGIRPFYNADEKKLAEKNMERMNITQYKNRCYSELSGGQQQRVLLARALCAAQKILLLDEPVSGLDPKVTEEMYGIIKNLNQDGVTIIMISHYIAAAIRYATTILHIEKEKVFFGTKDDYINSDQGKRFITSNGGETL